MSQQLQANMLGAEIGRGGFGTVYEMKDDPSICVKVSHKGPQSQSCRQWSNEYKKISTLATNIEKTHSNALKRLKYVRLLTPIKFHENNDSCYMLMPRIYRPDHTDTPQPTIQAQLGVETCKMVHKGRGEFIGLKEIRSFVQSQQVLEQVVKELGKAMALIHFYGKNDAYDIEVFLGIEKHNKTIRFYIADFDLSEEIKTMNPETIKRVVWSLDAVPYFPTKHTDPRLFDIFKNAYAKIAANDEIVEEIFKYYG